MTAESAADVKSIRRPCTHANHAPSFIQAKVTDTRHTSKYGTGSLLLTKAHVPEATRVAPSKALRGLGGCKCPCRRPARHRRAVFAL